MVTAQELIVAIRSEGVRETVSDLGGIEDSMEETAESTSEAAEQAEGFSGTFKGAMSAAVAALAVGAAGLLSQVPVVGEVFSGLGAVIDSVVVKIDEVLRPVLTPLTNAFFKLAQKISNADGTMGTIIGVVASVAAGLAVLAGIVLSVGAAIAPLVAGLGAVSTAATAIGGAIATVGGVLLSLPGILAIVIAAVVAFVAAYIFNIGGVRDKTNNILAKVFGFFVDLGNNIKSWATSTAASALEKGKDIAGDLLDGIIETGSGIIEWFEGLASDIGGVIGDIKDKAFNLGKGIIASIVKGLAGAVDVASGIIDRIGQAVGIDLSVGEVPDFGSVTRGDSADTGRPEQTGNTPAGSIGTTNQIDGQTLSESTGRFRRGPTARNGGL